jgi:hypothetical protein
VSWEVAGHGNGPRGGVILSDPGAAVSRGHSVCLAACVSGGLKSRSACGHGLISKSGVRSHWPKEEEGREKSTRARRRKPDTAKMDLQPPLVVLWRTGCSPRGESGRVCGAPPGRTRRERSHRGTGRPKLGNGRACTMEAKAKGFLPSVPWCVRATRWGRDPHDPGRPGRVRRAGRVAIVWHSQTKGRATAKTKRALEPPGGRRGYKRKGSSSRGAARSRSGVQYSRTPSEHKAVERCRVQRRCAVQKAEQRGKAPYSTERGKGREAVSKCRSVG